MKILATFMISLTLIGCTTTATHERYAPCDAYTGNCQPMIKMNVWE